MKGTIPYIIKGIKPKMTQNGFIKTKYRFEKALELNYKISFLITGLNFIDTQDIQVSIVLENAGKDRIMRFLGCTHFYEPGANVISFQFRRNNKMRDEYWGAFKEKEYSISTEGQADKFIEDFISFLDESFFSKKLKLLTDFDTIEDLINSPDVFTSPIIKDVDYWRFYNGLLFSSLSGKENITQIFNKYWAYTNGWDEESKRLIQTLILKLKSTDKKQLEDIYFAE